MHKTYLFWTFSFFFDWAKINVREFPKFASNTVKICYCRYKNLNLASFFYISIYFDTVSYARLYLMTVTVTLTFWLSWVSKMILDSLAGSIDLHVGSILNLQHCAKNTLFRSTWKFIKRKYINFSYNIYKLQGDYSYSYILELFWSFYFLFMLYSIIYHRLGKSNCFWGRGRVNVYNKKKIRKKNCKTVKLYTVKIEFAFKLSIDGVHSHSWTKP